MNVQIATQQPPTTAKVILYTSHGQIDLQLWAKQTPLASKNFIQHCLEGYYVNTIFHRLIPGFMIQGGDPSGTGMGGESIYDGPFRDEFHQRLKFTKREILAMADSGKKSTRPSFLLLLVPANISIKSTTSSEKLSAIPFTIQWSFKVSIPPNKTNPWIPPSEKPKSSNIPLQISNPSLTKKSKNNNKLQERMKPRKNMAYEPFEKENKNKKQELKKLKNKKNLKFQNEELEDEVPAPKVVSSHEVLYKKDHRLSNKTVITKEQLQMKKNKKNFNKNSFPQKV